MLRFVLAALILCAAGCGKSFQEADAIYKDEVAKLEKIETERSQECTKRSVGIRDLNKRKAIIARVFDEYQAAIESQETKVKSAYTAKEAAK